MISSQDRKIVENALKVLIEHFDSVQILVSRMAPQNEGTERCFLGGGNWFARKGMAQDFLDYDQQFESARQIADQLKPKD